MPFDELKGNNAIIIVVALLAIVILATTIVRVGAPDRERPMVDLTHPDDRPPAPASGITSTEDEEEVVVKVAPATESTSDMGASSLQSSRSGEDSPHDEGISPTASPLSIPVKVGNIEPLLGDTDHEEFWKTAPHHPFIGDRFRGNPSSNEATSDRPDQ